MTAMGGLRKYMPICNWAFLFGCLAISGIPPFSGFFSKDEILVAAYAKSPLWGIWLAVVAGMTAFYMFRLYYKIFWWNNPDYGDHKPHEAPWTMTLPLIILGLLALCAGMIPFGKYVNLARTVEYESGINWMVAGSSVLIALIGIGLATKLYLKENPKPDRMAEKTPGLWTAAYRRFYMDEFYQYITHHVIFAHVSTPIAWFDRHIIDGTMNMLARVTHSTSYSIRRFQSGNIQSYVWIYLIGALALATIVMLCVI